MVPLVAVAAGDDGTSNIDLPTAVLVLFLIKVEKVGQDKWSLTTYTTILHDLQRGKELSQVYTLFPQRLVSYSVADVMNESTQVQITSLLVCSNTFLSLTFSTFKEGPSGYSHVSLDAKPD